MRTNRQTPVPFSLDTALGDGFVAWADSQLKVMDLRAPTPTTTVITTLGAEPGGPTVGVQWAVDAYGGQSVAYVGADQAVHVVPVAVAASELELLHADVPSTFGIDGWTPEWTLNKPATWRLTIYNRFGTALHSTGGGSWGSSVLPTVTAVRRDASAWTLVVTPADGVGPELRLSGQVTIGASEHRPSPQAAKAAASLAGRARSCVPQVAIVAPPHEGRSACHAVDCSRSLLPPQRRPSCSPCPRRPRVRLPSGGNGAHRGDRCRGDGGHTRRRLGGHQRGELRLGQHR